MAGHGGTQGLPTSGLPPRRLRRADGARHRRARYPPGGASPATRWAGGSSPSSRRAGPSEPSPSLLIDAIVGDTVGPHGQRLPRSTRCCSAASARPGCSTPRRRCRCSRDPRQAAKLGPAGRRPTMLGHVAATRGAWSVRRISILRSRGSGKILDDLADRGRAHVRDPRRVRPASCRWRPPARRPPGADGQLVTVEKAGALVAAQGSRDAAGHRERAARGPAGRRDPRRHHRGRRQRRWTSSRTSSTRRTPRSWS